jgi:rhodanese-related sulfurtransferase
VENPPPFSDVAPAAARALLESPDPPELLDVRTPAEHSVARLAGPQQLLDAYDPAFFDALAALPRDRCYLVYCRTGNRSGFAVELMQRLGFQCAWNLGRGIKGWAQAGLPVEGD